VGVPWTVIVTAGRPTDQKGGGALMAFREIPMYEVKKCSGWWLAGYGYRTMEPMVRPDRHGDSWQIAVGVHDKLAGLHTGGLTVVKMHELLARDGVSLPERTLHHYVAELFGPLPPSTVPVADGEPGGELQVDFGELG
jgi:hypothetical protein